MRILRHDILPMAKSKPFQHVRILYDGECPFCAGYVKMARLKSMSGTVELMDARSVPDLTAEHARAGRNIDQGMIVELDDKVYFGGEAMWAINTLLSENWLLKHLSARSILVFVYPAMRAGRNLVLRIRGHEAILAEQKTSSLAKGHS